MSGFKIAVLGGGITGITLTDRLSAAGHDPTCFEGSPRTGGLCQSETIDGFVLDRAGGHILFSKDKDVLTYILEALGEGRYATSKRQTFIFYQGRYVQYPFENGLADLPDQARFTCLRDYVEAVFARRQGAVAPQNFHDWCLWRFGEGICREFMHPYNRKIWNVDLHELGTKWIHGRVPDAPMEDVLKSALGIKTEGYVHQAIFHYPLEGGFESLVNAIRRRIPSNCVRVATPCRSLASNGKKWMVNGEPFDRVVSSIPLAELKPLLVDAPPDIGAAIDALDYVSLLTVFIALDKPDPPPHSWIYFPHDEDGPQNRVTWLSGYSPRNAPPGCSSVMAEVTYDRRRGIDVEPAVKAVVDGLVGAGLFRRDQVRWTRTFDNRYAYILYRHGLEENLDRVRGYCHGIGLDLLGRFGNYNYFNSDMCIRAAMDFVSGLDGRS